MTGKKVLTFEELQDTAKTFSEIFETWDTEEARTDKWVSLGAVLQYRDVERTSIKKQLEDLQELKWSLLKRIEARILGYAFLRMDSRQNNRGPQHIRAAEVCQVERELLE